MKKVLLGLAALSAVSFAAQEDTYLNARFGGDLGASYTKYESEGTTILNDETDGFGGELALEGYKSLTDNFDLGLGLAYQLHADRADAPIRTSSVSADYYGVEYNSVPVYLTAKYNFNLDSEIKPYLKANLGYSFNFDSSDIKVKGSVNDKASTDVEDGLYWALGGGLEYRNFTVDLMYAVTTAESESKEADIKEDNDYGRVVLSAGYRFDL
ncbi:MULTISPECIES: outer membrane beta-barrel protein [Psychrilyobacter]|uniref:Porin family protein n=1 Tax=Psychrilyobacter piezotolerans TaxID=2293438 RepID=A0ABX9KGR8_9FUSO|nr:MULTISPECIES: outer membrane beta-barrel protein [Psychrilyobacter]MCS5422729.1 porin family protein [Psychrilyobacter sp. S5]NDI77979.1 porin family protein [Psychrilyobacter piezotolerans]RDE61923.1 porin family protein [Psychrilyobacter sp. S5]REI41149.1 porin family protein [Psychrilyobacter piezotolerans]